MLRHVSSQTLDAQQSIASASTTKTPRSSSMRTVLVFFCRSIQNQSISIPWLTTDQCRGRNITITHVLPSLPSAQTIALTGEMYMVLRFSATQPRHVPTLSGDSLALAKAPKPFLPCARLVISDHFWASRVESESERSRSIVLHQPGTGMIDKLR